MEPEVPLRLGRLVTGGAAWRLLDASSVNPYWGELEHSHNFSRQCLYDVLEEHGFEPLRYSVGERCRVCMEVIARRVWAV